MAARLTRELEEQFEEGKVLEDKIRENLKRLDASPSRD
jgi:hypothetical protein